MQVATDGGRRKSPRENILVIEADGWRGEVLTRSSFPCLSLRWKAICKRLIHTPYRWILLLEAYMYWKQVFVLKYHAGKEY